jgi:hypothetical protein
MAGQGIAKSVMRFSGLRKEVVRVKKHATRRKGKLCSAIMAANLQDVVVAASQHTNSFV